MTRSQLTRVQYQKKRRKQQTKYKPNKHKGKKTRKKTRQYGGVKSQTNKAQKDCHLLNNKKCVEPCVWDRGVCKLRRYVSEFEKRVERVKKSDRIKEMRAIDKRNKRKVDLLHKKPRPTAGVLREPEIADEPEAEAETEPEAESMQSTLARTTAPSMFLAPAGPNPLANLLKNESVKPTSKTMSKAEIKRILKYLDSYRKKFDLAHGKIYLAIKKSWNKLSSEEKDIVKKDWNKDPKPDYKKLRKIWTSRSGLSQDDQHKILELCQDVIIIFWYKKSKKT